MSEHEVIVFSYGKAWEWECTDCPASSDAPFTLYQLKTCLAAADQHRCASVAASSATPQQGEDAPKPCAGFHWIGQTFASCDRCGLPYWKHTHDEQPNYDAGPFSRDVALVPITAAQAAACARRWCPTCSGPTRETVGMVCQACGTDYGADLPSGATPQQEEQR